MLRKRYAKALVAGALTSATVLTAVAVSALPVSAKQEVERPFKAEGSGIGIFDDPLLGECGDLLFDGLNTRFECDQTIDQTMTGTHIGRSTRTGIGQLTIYVAQPCPLGAPGIPFVSNVVDTFVAANGDELFGSSEVTGCFIADDVPTQVAGTWEIDGGTGRFANATGEGTTSAVALGEALSTSLMGTLIY